MLLVKPFCINIHNVDTCNTLHSILTLTQAQTPKTSFSTDLTILKFLLIWYNNIIMMIYYEGSPIMRESPDSQFLLALQIYSFRSIFSRPDHNLTVFGSLSLLSLRLCQLQQAAV